VPIPGTPTAMSERYHEDPICERSIPESRG